LTARLSLRARVMVGAALWTAGLLTIASVIAIAALLGHPVQHAYVVRGLLLHPGAALAVAALCMFLGLWQVKKGLSALDELRQALAAVRDGREQQLSGSFPAEVNPLVHDLNALLDHRELTVRRAVAKAGDLAHGLKTPLAVLAQEAARARAAGHADLASSIDQQIDRMRRQIDYHLAQARAAASGAAPGARAVVFQSAEGLTRTLMRLHAARGVAIDLQVPREHAVRGQREDLDEMLGNLLDNACKWARARVVVSSAAGNGTVAITVDDDGPGIEPSMRQLVLQRGVRADEAAPGSGLGLAIVRDLADVYGGSIALDASPLGGLRARLDLPAPHDGAR
jgi:signal transduction histidine kinase